ncbi:MAG: hypothetical protein JXR95_15950 [Deltaproteobacteria bacterium]|nr:hypothetical protein [Deltaproteobacteria bacterium]
MEKHSYSNLSSREIISGIFQAVYSLTPGRDPGSHTEIFALDSDRLCDVLISWVEKETGTRPAKKHFSRIKTFSDYFSSRFLLKVGRTDNFTMRLGGRAPLEVPRSLVSEIFGNIGYSLFPTWRKTVMDSTEASREIPYFYNGNGYNLFFPNLCEFIRELLENKIEYFPDGSLEGEFLFKSTEDEEAWNLFRLLAQDRYSENNIDNMDQLRLLSDAIRANPLDRKTTEILRNFFNAPITVGVRDAIRWLSGARHPKMKWDEARQIISDCFEKHGAENFLLPEQTFYIHAPNQDGKKIEGRIDNNSRFLDAATEIFYDRMNAREQHLFDSNYIRKILSDAFEYHHSYPLYKLEDTMGYVNPALAGVVLKFVQYAGLFFSGVKLPARRNTNIVNYLQKRGVLEEVRDKLLPGNQRRFLSKLLYFILDYDLRGGIRYNNEMLMWQSIPTTFCTFQERADFLPDKTRKIDQFSLEDLAKTEYSFYLRRYPELAEKLVVFFVLVLRFFMDTDFIPDLRPDEAGINIFILGIWGYMTENLLIILYEDEHENHHFRIKFVDNKDHFKQYKREVDREEPMGIAKHGMRIVQPVVVPAMLRAVGNFVQIVSENKQGLVRKEINLKGLIDYTVAVAQEVVVKGINYGTEGIQSVITDGFDDAAKIASSTVSRIIPGREKDDRMI